MLFVYMQQKSNEKLETLLDINSYDESQLVELKIPVNLPYQNSWTSFERFDGEIELNGILYKYVKRRLLADTLYLMCIPNTKKMYLETAKNKFFKISSNLAENNNSNKSDNSLQIFKTYQLDCNSSFDLRINAPFAMEQQLWFPVINSHLLNAPHIFPEQPPDLHAV